MTRSLCTALAPAGSLHAFSGHQGAAAARPLVLGWLSCRRAIRRACSRSGALSPDHTGVFRFLRYLSASVRVLGSRGVVAFVGSAAVSTCSDSDPFVIHPCGFWRALACLDGSTENLRGFFTTRACRPRSSACSPVAGALSLSSLALWRLEVENVISRCCANA